MKKSNPLIMTKKLSLILSGCAAAFFYTQSIQAEELPQRGPIPFYIYDINANGSISQDEFNTIRGLRMKNWQQQGRPIQNMALEPNFNEFDSDNNGQLSPAELNRGQQMQRQKHRQMRQNQMAMRQGQAKGMNSTRKLPKFEDFDLDKNGLLTPEEFNIGMRQYMQQRQAMRSGQRRGRNMPSFTDFDGNKDGYISEQELIEARSMRISSRIQQGYQMRNTANIPPFQEIDKNNDGKISPEEFSAQQKQHRH